ncbi:hypothetical protein B0T10DRAFT_519951 [Thelonectria olida]|uniref:Uncharacterized protein n=1 Tax=Thelonectria olida TaxID=1576542 RepID=A0A9P9AJX1_9HYPO|nr:hypothetical protein B0T10DRAFT_519951 [Thelonectria olida]
MMGEYFDLTYSIAQRLLLPQTGSMVSTDIEEELHPWLTTCVPVIDQPLLRLWDCYSRSHPNENNCMRSRHPRKRLDTAESRIDSLTTHIDNRIWEPTPYISFTSAPGAIEKLAGLRSWPKRGPHTLTVIHPGVRRRKRLPILDVGAEMDHYSIPNPYGRLNEYYKDHYVCLWEVTAAEIVGHWPWNSLSSNPNWYDDVVLPAFEQFGRKPMANVSPCDFGLSDAMANLSVFDKRCDTKYDDDSDSCSEGLAYYLENDLSSETDTDDEVEEANRTDDMIKIIEGDW